MCILDKWIKAKKIQLLAKCKKLNPSKFLGLFLFHACFYKVTWLGISIQWIKLTCEKPQINLYYVGRCDILKSEVETKGKIPLKLRLTKK